MSERNRQKVVYKLVREAAMRQERPTVDDVAAATGIPRSSVAYVAKSMGYKGWADFTGKMLRYFAQESTETELSKSVDLLVEQLLRAQSKLVLVAAVGDAEICIDYILHHMSESGIWAVPYSEGVLEHDAGRHNIAALIVINESGMALLPACLEAYAARCQVISITASHDTPVSKVSSLNVIIKNNKSDIRNYKPNYFTAGVLVFLEKVIAELEKRAHLVPASLEGNIHGTI